MARGISHRDVVVKTTVAGGISRRDHLYNLLGPMLDGKEKSNVLSFTWNSPRVKPVVLSFKTFDCHFFVVLPFY